MSDVKASDALSVPCPKCRAKPGRPCNPHTDAKTGARVPREPHQRRIDAAKAAPGIAAVPLWQDYEIDTDDVCTLDGFDGVCLMTGEVTVQTGLRMSRETARTLADRLDAFLKASPMPIEPPPPGWHDGLDEELCAAGLTPDEIADIKRERSQRAAPNGRPEQEIAK